MNEIDTKILILETLLELFNGLDLQRTGSLKLEVESWLDSKLSELLRVKEETCEGCGDFMHNKEEHGPGRCFAIRRR